MTQPNYLIEIRDRSSGISLASIDRYQNLTFQKVLNREGDFSFDMSIMDLKADPAYINHRLIEVYIHRNSDIVFGGVMIGDSGTVKWGDDMVTVNGKGFFEILSHRFTDPNNNVTYNEDVGSIAWDNINYTQGLTNGNIGITEGTIQTSVVRNPTYTRKKISQLITEMGSDSIDQGYEFEITQTKQFNVYYPAMGSDKSNEIVFIGGKNIAQIDFTHDFTAPINQAIVEGAGSTDTAPIAIVDDTTLQGQYGLLQDVLSSKDTLDTSILQAKGQQSITKNGRPRIQYTLTQTPGSDPDFTSLGVGDWVRVDVDRGYLSVHDKVRIVAIKVTYDTGTETPQYIFNY